MISVTPKIEQARATDPNLLVFSLKCGVSETRELGMAKDSRLLFDSELNYPNPRGNRGSYVLKMNLIAVSCTLLADQYVA
jgi:hypothetical protein